MKNTTHETIVDQIHSILLEYDIPPHLIGYNLLAEAISIKLSDPYSSIKSIYATIAAKCRKTVRSVARDLDYAIKQAHNLGNILHLPEEQLFNSRVISILAIHIKTSICPPPPCGVSRKQQKNRAAITDRPNSRYQSRLIGNETPQKSEQEKRRPPRRRYKYER